jgi:uncharacterized protein (DUF58 family)
VILPTRLALVFLGGLSLVALAGVFAPAALDAVLVGDALIVVLVVADGLVAVPARRLSVEREAGTTFTVGRETAITYRWRNQGRWTARVLVREVRPAILGGTQVPRALVVPRLGLVWDPVAVTALRRGRECAGWLAVRSTGPLGLGRRLGRIPLPWDVRVYPHLPAGRLKASIAAAATRRDAGLRAQRHPGEGRQFESLREWVPGDDIRRIDWKATARRRKVIARRYEEERRQQVLLVLDAGRLLAEEMDGGESRFEHAVRAAQLLALAAVYHDDNVGIMVFAERLTHYVAPQRGRRGLRRVLDVLAEAEPRMVEPDYPAAFRHLAVRNRKRALTVVFTDAVDRLASEALVSNVASLSPRHLPLVVTLRNVTLDRVAGARPVVTIDAYRKAAAEELLHARDEALASMRQAGALVLDVDPRRASAAVVERYLELKRRGRL